MQGVIGGVNMPDYLLLLPKLESFPRSSFLNWDPNCFASDNWSHKDLLYFLMVLCTVHIVQFIFSQEFVRVY